MSEQEVIETEEIEPTETEEVENVEQEPEEDSGEDTFPRSYVERLRDENAKYRQRAQRSDELAERLHRELVARTGRLADPADLPFDEAHLDDPEALAEAVEELVAAKPHLASRKPTGSVGQGVMSGASTTVDLAGILRSRA